MSKQVLYKIEKGIPFPQGSRSGKWKGIVAKMGLGDSVLVKKSSEQKSLRQTLFLSGFGSRSEKEGKFIRIWKKEKGSYKWKKKDSKGITLARRKDVVRKMFEGWKMKKQNKLTRKRSRKKSRSSSASKRD